MVQAGKTFYFSGQTGYNGVNYDGEILDITAQTEIAFSHLSDVMETVSVAFDDVVKANVFLTDMSYFDEMNQVYQSYFKDSFPARTCVAVVGLPLKADVEIELVAYNE